MERSKKVLLGTIMKDIWPYTFWNFCFILKIGELSCLTQNFCSVSWAQTKEFLQKGGQAVAGMELCGFYSPQNPCPLMDTFTAANWLRVLNNLGRGQRTCSFLIPFKWELRVGISGEKNAFITGRCLSGNRHSGRGDPVYLSWGDQFESPQHLYRYGWAAENAHRNLGSTG